MTNKAIQTFLAARGKTGAALVDYVVAGDEIDGSTPTFPIWNVAQLGAVPTAAEVIAMREADAQREIDNWPIAMKALALALIDQLNVIRAGLPVPLGAITPAQAIAAVRTKAGTL